MESGIRRGGIGRYQAESHRVALGDRGGHTLVLSSSGKDGQGARIVYPPAIRGVRASPTFLPGQRFPVTSSNLCASLRAVLYRRSRCWLLGMKALLKPLCVKGVERSEGKGTCSIECVMNPRGSGSCHQPVRSCIKSLLSGAKRL